MYMKRRFTLFVLLLGTWLSSFAATIPAGSTIYLYPGYDWGCMATYVIYCSGWNPQGYQIFTPLPGSIGVYQCTLTKSVSSNIYFGASNQVKTSDGTGWIGDFCQNKYETSQNGWSSSTPCWIVDDVTGVGHWGAIPADAGSEFDASIDDVTFEVISSCVNETYDIVVTATFQGDACSFKLTGSQFKRDIIRSNFTSPVTYTVKNLPATQNPQNEYITFSLCADGAGASPIASKTVDYTTPTLDCEIVHDPIEVCEGAPDVVLEASIDGDSYLWSTGETTKSISVPSDQSTTYTVEVFAFTHSAKDNLMANGNFEEEVPDGVAPPGFTSSYNYAGKFDPSQYYSDHGGTSNIYAITHNANYFWRDFADIEPHEGNYYAIFDAGREGFAWKATTQDNTSLSVEKDSVYLFSYWVAYPNIQADRSPAILQFQIAYTDPAGEEHTQDLGEPYTLGQEERLNEWYHQEIQWTAPCNSASVTISVVDRNSASSGNDFCLDNILFQRTKVGRTVLAKKDIFTIVSQECGAIKDTICLGEHYTENGFDVTPTEAGTHTYNDPNSERTLSLFVTEPIQATFTAPGMFCNYGGDEFTIPFTVQTGIPVTYSLNSDNRLIKEAYKEPLDGTAIPVSAYDSIFEATKIQITLFDEFGYCDPFTTDITLDFRRCNYMKDTTCSGTPYDKNGFTHPADIPGTYKLDKDNDTLLLTVIESLDIAIQQPAPLCNLSFDTTLVISYNILSGTPYTYSLYFDTRLIADVIDAPLEGNQFKILVPATVDETVQVTFYAEEATGHCAFSKQFSIGMNAGVTIYRKWDDVLFVDNGEGDYTGYQWYCDGVAIEGATHQDYYTGQPLDNDGHAYHVVMTRADGTTDISCPMKFGEAAPSAQQNPGEPQAAPLQVRHYLVGAHVDIIETIYDDGSINVQKRIVP